MRGKAIKVKTAKSKTVSSVEWLKRQLNDPYVLLAKKEGYRSRSAYKIIEINEKFRVFKPGQKVIDLGAAPGGWSQVAASFIKSDVNFPASLVVAIDLLEIEPIAGVNIIQGDFCDPQSIMKINEFTKGAKCDIVMSDMAANTTGHAATDHLKIMYLCEEALKFAKIALKTDGNFIAKIFQGGAEASLLNELKKHFKKVKHFKPKSSRQGSKESYLIAVGFKD